MNDFKIIYRILKYLQSSLDVDEPDFSVIGAEALNMTQAKWSRIMKMLADSGYIDGLIIVDVDNAPYPFVRFSSSTALTLKGMEYLEENSLMKKAAKIAKGVADIIPHP